MKKLSLRKMIESTAGIGAITKSLNEEVHPPSISDYYHKFVGTSREDKFWEVINQYYKPSEDGESEATFLRRITKISPDKKHAISNKLKLIK